MQRETPNDATPSNDHNEAMEELREGFDADAETVKEVLSHYTELNHVEEDTLGRIIGRTEAAEDATVLYNRDTPAKDEYGYAFVAFRIDSLRAVAITERGYDGDRTVITGLPRNVFDACDTLTTEHGWSAKNVGDGFRLRLND